MRKNAQTSISLPFGWAITSTQYGEGLYSYNNNFGYTTGVPTSGYRTVWPGSGIYQFPSAPFTPEALSASTKDKSTGPGARTMTVEGLGADYSTRSETVTLQGTTPTTFTSTGWLRIARAYVETAGSSGNNVGKLTVRPASGGTTYAIIKAGNNQTAQAAYTVPAGYRGYLIQEHISAQAPASGSAKTGPGEFELRVRTSTGGVFHLEQAQPIEGVHDHHYLIPPTYPAKTDIRYDAQAHSSDVDVGVEFTILLQRVTS